MKKTFLTLLLGASSFFVSKDANAQAGAPKDGGQMEISCAGQNVTGIQYFFDKRNKGSGLDATSQSGSSVLTYVPASKEMKAVGFFTDAAREMGIPAGLRADKVVDVTALGNEKQKDFAVLLMETARNTCSKNGDTYTSTTVPISPNSPIAKTAPSILNGMK